MKSIINSEKLKNIIVLTLLLTGASFLRLWNLSADPPASMDIQFICDEGWWIHNAKNHATFGQWVMDDFNQSLLISPTYCMMTRASYALLGVGFASSRLPAAVSGIGCLIVFYAIMRRSLSHHASIAAVILLGYNYSFTELNRVAFIDTTAFFFVLLSWFLMEIQHPIITICSGLAYGLAVTTKSYSLAALPVIGILFGIHIYANGTKSALHLIKKTLLFFSGTVLVLIGYFVIIVHPYQVYFDAMYHLWQSGNIPSSPIQTLKNIPSTFINLNASGIEWQKFFTQNISLLIMAWISMMTSFRASKLEEENNKLVRMKLVAYTSWIVFCAEILPLTAKPFRRYIFLYIPLIILGSILLDNVFSSESPKPSIDLTKKRMRLIFYLPPVVFLSIPAASIMPLRIPESSAVSAIVNVLAGFSLVAFIFGALSSFSFFNKFVTLIIRSRTAIILLVAMDAVPLMISTTATRHSLYDASKWLGTTIFKEKTVVLGGFSHTLGIENTIHPITIWGREGSGYVLNADPVKRFHPEYLVILRELDGIAWPSEERLERYADPLNKIETLHLLPLGENRYRVKADIYKMPQETLVSRGID